MDTQKDDPKVKPGQPTEKAQWQPPVLQEYDATREIKGTGVIGGDLLVLS